MWSGTESRQLDNFDESIVGRASIFINRNNIQPYWYVASGSQPFAKKILITHIAGLNNDYDTIFKPKDGLDFSLILSYILHLQGNIYIQSEIELPEQFILGLYKTAGKNITLVTLLHQNPRSIKYYTNIFFEHIQDYMSPDTSLLIAFLKTHHLVSTSDDEIRAYIKELRITSGGLVWNKMNGIYWYDPVDCNPPAVSSSTAKAAIQKQVINGLQMLTSQLQSIM